MVGAGAKAAGSKITSTVSGVISGMASQLTEGVPFAPEMLAFAGTKIKGAFGGRGTSSAQKEMAAKLQGGDEDETAAEEQGGTSSPVEKAKEELLGGTSTGGGGDAGGGLEFTNELLINIDENLQFIRDNTETAESRRERLRDKGAAAGGLLKKRKMAGIPDEEDSGFWSNLLGSFLGAGGGTGLGGFFGGKGGKGSKGLPLRNAKGQFTKAPTKGVNPASLLKGGGFKSALSLAMPSLLLSLKPMLAFLVSPPGLIALAAAATAGGLWWAGSKLLEKESAEEISEKLEKVKSGPVQQGRGKHQTANLEKVRQNRIKRLEEDLAEAKERESGVSEPKGEWVWEGLGRQRKRVWKGEDLVKTKMKKGGIVPGKKGEPTPVLAHGEEIFFDNEAADTMKSAVETLRHIQKTFGGEMMPVQKGWFAGQSAEELKKEGYVSTMFIPQKFMEQVEALQDEGSPWQKGMEQIKDVVTLISSETAFHRLMGIDNVNEQAESTYGEKFGMAHKKLLFGMTGKEEALWESLHELGLDFGAGKSNRMFEASQKLQGMSLEQLLDLKGGVQKYMRTGQVPKEITAMTGIGKGGIHGLGFGRELNTAALMHGRAGITGELNQAFTGNNEFNSLSMRGTQLNNAAMNRIGLNGGVWGGSPHVIDTSSTQVVNNTTIVPPIEPNGPALPFGYANARS